MEDLDRIAIYIDKDKKSPFRQQLWLDLDHEARSVIKHALLRILEIDNRFKVSTKLLKSLGGDLYELRISRPLLLRVFISFRKNGELLVLHGYNKRKRNSKRFQQAQIHQARMMLKEFMKNGQHIGWEDL